MHGDARRAVAYEAESLSDGCGMKIVCPECGGGDSEEVSMLVRRDGPILWCVCYRASCSVGWTKIVGHAPEETMSRPPPKPKDSWDGATEHLTEEDAVKFGLVHAGIGMRMTDDGRLLIPMCDGEGVRRGDLVRQAKPYDPSKPKQLSFFDPTEYNGMAWFFPEGEPYALCLVEDPLSAIRLSLHDVIGVSLNGVHLTAERVRAIRTAWRGPIYLALDADATQTALRAARKWRGVADIRTKVLFNDVKDMAHEELVNFLATLLSN